MTFLYRFLSVLLIAFLSSISTLTTATLEAAPFRVGVYKMPPHMFHDNDEAHGAAVDYFKIVAERMGLSNVVFEGYPLSRLLKNNS